MNQPIDTQRIDLLKTSILDSGLCKTLVNMASDLTAAEWAHVIIHKDEYECLLMLFLNTYKPEVTESIVSEGHIEHQQLLVELFQLWYVATCKGSTDIEHTLTATELSYTPLLRPLFTGHLLKMFASSDLGEDCELFIRTRIKKVASELLEIANQEGEDVRNYIFGTRSTAKIYPHLNDYSQEEKDFSVSFLYLLSALTQALDLLDINRELTPEREGYLNAGDISSVISTSDFDNISKLRNERQYAEAEAYIVSEYPKFESLMSNYVLNSHEKNYIRSLYLRGLLVFTPQETNQPPEQKTTLSAPDSELHQVTSSSDEPSISLNVEYPESSSKFDLMSGLKTGLATAKEKLFATPDTPIEDQSHEPPLEQYNNGLSSDADDINDMILSSKKKGKGFSLFCIIFFSLAILFLTLTLKVSSDEPTSVIEQSTNQTDRDFKIVIVE